MRADGFFLQDSAEPYSGILVYTDSYPTVVQGDLVQFGCAVIEYYGMTECDRPGQVEVLSHDYAIPDSIRVSTGDVGFSTHSHTHTTTHHPSVPHTYIFLLRGKRAYSCARVFAKEPKRNTTPSFGNGRRLLQRGGRGVGGHARAP